ncbi:CCA tRNA nucleotidyltransferase [Paenibacillus thailandensis]|uniref:CCA tRNA nucleotidyltransferase n=1 Tax=Paenibacillus thailandensis TaxID=393250 RepID=A0ABW5QZV0_9BACL
MRIEMPDVMKAALPILERLAEGGYEAVFVGGSVRDILLQRPITDVDIATSAQPDEVMRLFERTVPTGIQHGTVTVLAGDRAYEVTTYRQESAYENHRKPESVSFISDLEGDLMRRDLTINAIALRADGTVIDPFGGIRDLREGIVRCVGDADARFDEDALRMLRAVRFMAEFGFRCSPDTWEALLRRRSLLRHIAMERVRMELDKMIGGASPGEAIAVLNESGLLSYTKDPLEARFFGGDGDFRSGRAYGALDRLQLPADRWACLLLLHGAKAEEAERTLDALRFAGKRKDEIALMIRLHMDMTGEAERTGCFDEAADPASERLRRLWVKLVVRHGTEAAESWLRIVRAANAAPYARAADWLENCLRSMPVATLRELRLNGKELAAHLERRPGSWTGEWLNRLLIEAALGRIKNGKEELLAQADIWKAEECAHE